MVKLRLKRMGKKGAPFYRSILSHEGVLKEMHEAKSSK